MRKEKFTPGVVFPTPVGVFLSYGKSWAFKESLPHTRGGVSRFESGGDELRKSSPHPWGCFFCVIQHGDNTIVFPTPVGVFLKIYMEGSLRNCLPHTRGGVSTGLILSNGAGMSSPHPWGCFYCEG